MGKRDDGFIIILDTNKVFSDEELEIVQNAGTVTSDEVLSEN